MSKGVVEKSVFQNIANALRKAFGNNKKYKPNEMAVAINDLSYYVVPVQTTLVRVERREIYPGTGIYADYYTIRIKIYNDKPTEYPNLVYTTYLTEAQVSTTATGLRLRASKTTKMFDSDSALYYPLTGSYDECNIDSELELMYDLTALGQTYAIYGKRKG